MSTYVMGCSGCSHLRQGDIVCIHPKAVKNSIYDHVIIPYWYDNVNYKIIIIDKHPEWCPLKRVKRSDWEVMKYKGDENDMF